MIRMRVGNHGRGDGSPRINIKGTSRANRPASLNLKRGSRDIEILIAILVEMTTEIVGDGNPGWRKDTRREQKSK